MKHISTMTMRRQLGKYLDLVAEKKEAISITRANKTLAVLVPPEEHEEYRELVGDRERRRNAARRMDELREKTDPIDVVALVRQIRESR